MKLNWIGDANSILHPLIKGSHAHLDAVIKITRKLKADGMACDIRHVWGFVRNMQAHDLAEGALETLLRLKTLGDEWEDEE